MMKTLIRKFCICTVLCLSFVGCRDSIHILPHQTLSMEEGTIPVPVIVKDIVPSSRSIAPSHIGVADLRNYSLEMSGNSDMGDTLPPTPFFHTNGQGVLALPLGNWTLRLAATDPANSNALILEDIKTVVVKEKTEAVYFTLTPPSTGTETGSINLTISWMEADRAWVQGGMTRDITVSTSLCDAVTGTVVAGTTSSMERLWNANTSNLPTSFTYTGNTSPADSTPKPAGLYKLLFKIEGGNIPVETGSVEWSDLIYVEPGRSVAGTINIPQLFTQPNAPGAFSRTTTAITGGGTFTATLSWHEVYNANYYELQIMKYGDGTPRPTDENTWTTAAAASTVYTYTGKNGDGNNYTNPSHAGAGIIALESGSLLAGHTQLKLKVQMKSGEGFAARLRAVNDFGASAWIHLGTSLVPEAPFPPSNFAAEVGAVEANDIFNPTLSWDPGIMDANGYYRMELITFTAGNAPSAANWNNQTGSRVYTYGRTGNPTTPARVASGGFLPSSTGVGLTITGTTVYYSARIQAVNSNGTASAWTYLPTVMIPMTVIVADAPTQVLTNKTTWDNYLNKAVNYWTVTLTIRGPKIGTNYPYEWIMLGTGTLAQAKNETGWSRLHVIKPENRGSNRTTLPVGTTSKFMDQMNKDTPFLFRIRTRTPYGDSPWFYYDKEVRQLP